MEERIQMQNIEFEKFNLMLRRFDEVISEKASKVDLNVTNKNVQGCMRIADTNVMQKNLQEAIKAL